VLGVLWSFVRPLAQIEADYAGKLRPASDPLFLGKPATPAGKPAVFDLSRKAGYPSPLSCKVGAALLKAQNNELSLIWKYALIRQSVLNNPAPIHILCKLQGIRSIQINL
jgi:hypothetical protein